MLAGGRRGLCQQGCAKPTSSCGKGLQGSQESTQVASRAAANNQGSSLQQSALERPEAHGAAGRCLSTIRDIASEAAHCCIYMKS